MDSFLFAHKLQYLYIDGMTENVSSLVQRFRAIIYKAMFIFVLLYAPWGLCHLHSNETSKHNIITNEKSFWPADMIPHPHPPSPKPKDGMANKQT